MKVMKKLYVCVMISGIFGSVLLSGCQKSQENEDGTKKLESVKAVCERMFTYPDSRMDDLREAMGHAATTIGLGVENGQPSEEDTRKVDEMMEDLYGTYFTETGYDTMISSGTLLDPIMKIMDSQGTISLESVKEVKDSSDEDQMHQYETVIQVDGKEIKQNLQVVFDGDKIEKIEFVEDTLFDVLYENMMVENGEE